ncbi:MAG: prolyl oligopeptidase family serine peptidase, partial [Marinilabilia sp.]
YLPENFEPEKTYPLVVMLHGAMSNHRLALRRVFGKTNLPGESDAEASRYFPEWDNEEYIVVAPYARGTMGYVGIPEEDVMQVIEKTRKDFNIDRNRIYLTGLSMGGGGTLFIGLSRPDLFAAIAPVCPAPPPETFDLLENALNLPVAIHQGGADPVVRPEGTRQIVDELRNTGTMVEYHEYPGVQHDSWDNAYAEGKIFDWFDKIERNPFPDRVRFATKRYKYSSAYWLKIDKLMPGDLSRVDARFADTNQIKVEAENIDAFTLDLSGHDNFNKDELLEVVINGEEVSSLPKLEHGFTRENGEWEARRYHAPVMAKKQGLEGPLDEVLNDRHVFVYGTLGVEDEAEYQRRKEKAFEAADFSVTFGGDYYQESTINPRVIPDQDVSSYDRQHSNLILLGDHTTNSIIAEIKDKLPVHLKDSTGTYGMVYIYPHNGNYVVVNSGVPFWESRFVNGQDEEKQTTTTFGGKKGARALQGMKDFEFYRDSNSNVIVDGYFKHDWSLPEEALEKMEETGAVVDSVGDQLDKEMMK